MYNKLAHQQYKSVQVSTIDRGRLLMMLYDGCIKFLKHAIDGLEKKDLAKFGRFLSKAQAIIVELINTLDFEKGGDIAKDLDRLYDFMMFYLTEANLQKDPAKILKVIELLETISKAYSDILESGAAADVTDLPEAPGARPVKMPAAKEEPKAEPLPGKGLSVSF